MERRDFLKASLASASLRGSLTSKHQSFRCTNIKPKCDTQASKTNSFIFKLTMAGPTKRAYRLENHQQVTLVVVPTVFTALALAFTGLRLYARRLKRLSFLADDYLCVVSCVGLDVIQVICV